MISNQTREVALREIRTRSRSKGFRAVTAIMVLMAIAAPVIFAIIPGPDNSLADVTVGIGAEAPPRTQQYVEALATDRLNVSFIDLSDSTTAGIDSRLESGDIDVAIESPTQLAWRQEEDSLLASIINAALQQDAALQRATELGLTADDVGELFTPAEITARFVDDADDATQNVRRAVALFGLFISFILPQVFGQFTMLSVVEEKSTRVVEVLLSHIRPATLLAGKVIGLCTLAIVQLVLILVGLVATLLVTDLVDIPSSVWQFVPMLALSVVGGLAIYTTLFALIGSLISRQEDAAQVIMPVFVPLLGGYMAGQAAAIGDVDNLLIRLLTLFPLTTPMLLPVRVARGTIGPIETVVAVTLLALSVWGLLRLAARIYEFTLLRTGSRVGWREALRMSRGVVVDGPRRI